MKLFLKWWLLISLTILGLGIATYFNFISFVYTNDLTKLTIVIFSLFIATTIVIGYKVWNQNVRKK